MQTMFSVPLYRFVLSGWPAKKDRILKALPEITDQHRSPAGDTFTDFFLNNEGTSLPAYKDVVLDAISDCLEEFREDYPAEIDISSMWFERSFKSNYHGAHNHGSLGFSSILFLEFDQVEHNATRFIAPFMGFYAGGLIEHRPKGVSEGTLLMFPAIILHEVEPNQSDKQRTIVSFNVRGAQQ